MKIKCASSFYIVNKGIFNIGSVVEMDDEIAVKLIEQGVAVEYNEEESQVIEQQAVVIEQHVEEPQEVAVECTEETQTIKKEEINYNSLTVKALKELLIEKGLSTKGRKSELIERLQNN